jgi:hypothetical protein
MNIKNIPNQIVTVLLCCLATLCSVPKAEAQVAGNEWIRPGNTYYKFRIAKEGIYRIGKAQLDQLGFGTVPGNQFAIFREGQEVPVFTTTVGTFSSNDYIEFYATKANGLIDKELYTSPSFQPNEDINLISDTAYYFITYDNTPHQRLAQINNSVPVPTPGASAYCWATVRPVNQLRSNFNQGQSHAADDYFYNSTFDLAEGYAYNGLNGPSTGVTINTPQVYAAGPYAEFSFAFAGHSKSTVSPFPPVPHATNVRINGNQIFDTTYTGYDLIKRKINASVSLLSASNSFTVHDIANFFLQEVSIRYPRTYNFSGEFSSEAAFQTPGSDRYLEISGFSTGAARLYERNTGKIYTASESGGLLRFYLDIAPGSTLRNLFLTTNSSIQTVTSFSPVQILDFSSPAAQGNYIILSHRNYIEASPSYINEYKAYRSSIAGGEYSPVVVDVTRLYDQFGYGYEYHSIAIKRFIAYALEHWDLKPEYLFIIGKGVRYISYNAYLNNASSYSYSPVPTWGDPGSDVLFSCFDNNKQTPSLITGRLSAWNNEEIGNYLEKVKKYEQALKPAALPTAASELWKKKAAHIAGSSDISLQSNWLVPSLRACADVYEDTLIGGSVTTVRKNSTTVGEDDNSKLVDTMMNRGVSRVTFFGHASSSGFDFNLNTPENYNSAPRYPIFDAYGCFVATIFTLTQTRTISERYINAPNGGAIAMIAGNNTGWTGNLATYMQNLYRSSAFRNYDKNFGFQYRSNIEFIQNSFNSPFWDIHTQSLLFQGDPGLQTFKPELPDYSVEDEGLSSLPANVTTANDSFELRAIVHNLGKARHDSVWVKLQHFRQGANSATFIDSVLTTRLYFSDTIRFKIPVDPVRDIGLNSYYVKVDAREEFEEGSEENNQAVLQLFIYSENLIPVYPREFAIVHDQNITLKASTLNAFAPARKYRLELDTTIQFDSPLKQSTEILSFGGVVKWNPGVVYQDSTVYYWRAAPDSMINGAYSWTTSSFIYLQNGSDGWSQSHYYQLKRDEPFRGLALSENTGRKFAYTFFENILKAENAVVFEGIGNFDQVRESLNDVPLLKFACQHDGTISVAVIDSVTAKPWMNTAAGLYGSLPACSPNEREMFEFPVRNTEERNVLKDFLESIPQGNYVLVRNYLFNGPPIIAMDWNRQAAPQWMADQDVNGPGVSLYHTLKNMGFDNLDQYDSKKPFIFFRQKGIATYPVYQVVGADSTSYITFDAIVKSYPDTGIVQSTVIGPALEWKSIKLRYSAPDNLPDNDSAYIQIRGINPTGQESLLYQGFTRDTSLSFIAAGEYPNIRLVWYSVDNISRTSAHLDYWRVLYSPAPEAALNAAGYFEFTDSLSEGQTGKLNILVENLTPVPMDSLLVSFRIIDQDNVSHPLSEIRYRPLAGEDTLMAALDLNLDQYPGHNLIFVEVNPRKDQPEQYHPNNLGYLKLYMNADNRNPLLDVTFDGVHILDKDIVSAKPLIKVLLHDDSKYLELNDTALMSLQLLYPGSNTPVNIPMDGTICKFIPANIEADKKNEAYIEFRPTLEYDGVYRLIVSGRDKVGNLAGGTLKYEINFTVENKPSITHVLNYPNPFSTSTQFIFTMTGSEVPSQFKIQILTITGKVVREIKKHELGNLHIGRNMTDYRWDGKDEYGQLLGNGVYLYRVVTSIRGENIEHRKNASVDKFFKNGYGKLYIMR